jgi:dihydroneopterin aldolase
MNNTIESILSIDNVRVKANHGWYKSERKLGGMYVISVHIYKILEANHDFDHLDQSINYEMVHQVILETMEEEHMLIESACKAIWDKLKVKYSNEIWEVNIRKEDVPLKFVESTSFKIKG